jgi:glycosyltransferase involved in cell wall biosynthesis
MKIACIATSRIPSSTANSIQVMKACNALAQLGHAVHLLVPEHESAPSQPSWQELQSIYGLGKDFGGKPTFMVEWLKAHPKLKRYDFSLRAVNRACSLQADIAYVWPLQAGVFALLRRLPVILELHGEPEGRLGPAVFRIFLRLSGKKRLLPITRALADYLERIYQRLFPLDQVVIAPNGVELERYDDLPPARDARHMLGLPEGVTAGYTGHLYPGRGMGLLVELARRYIQVQFLWVGGRSEDVTRWQAHLEDQDIRNVTLTGFVENSRLPLYQAAMDILLMPYERVIEGSSGGNSADFCSPMKMFEYMACGRAIISSDLPVIREVLTESNAVLVPPEDETAWSAALGALIDDPLRREVLGSTAREAVTAYTWQSRARKALAGF